MYTQPSSNNTNIFLATKQFTNQQSQKMYSFHVIICVGGFCYLIIRNLRFVFKLQRETNSMNFFSLLLLLFRTTNKINNRKQKHEWKSTAAAIRGVAIQRGRARAAFPAAAAAAAAFARLPNPLANATNALHGYTP